MTIRCGSCDQDNRVGARYCKRCGSALEAGDADALVGRMVHERYRIQSVIGEGGMGRVYLAEQQMGTATRAVAIKVLHAKLGREERVRKRFYRECEVVIQLTHPNTIHFLDFGELDGRLFIVMEYVDGPTLTDELSAGPMPVERVDHLLEQIVGSLSEAHAMGVVHRDLKPDNVMLTTRGGEADFVKVCDFGIAQQRGEGPEITLEGTIIGTPQYMSPEQLTGAPVDARSDVYSLGLILFEMLAGTRPFHANTPLQWATLHTTQEPPSLDAYPSARDLPPRRKDAIRAALSKSALDRPQSVRELAARFLGREIGRTATPRSDRPPAVSVDAPTVNLRTPPSAEVLAPAGIRPAFGGLAGVLFLIGIVASGTALYLQRDRLMQLVDPGVADGGLSEVGLGDAGFDGGPEASGPTEWLQIVHFQRRIENAANALGAPDGEYATVPPSGTLVLELRAGTRMASDGTSGPDIALMVDDDRTVAYRADVGVDQNQYTTVGSELVGSLELDTDQFDITRIRYVRIKNRSRRNLYVDAVGAYRTIPTDAQVDSSPAD